MSTPSYLNEIKAFVPLTKQEEQLEFKKAKKGDLKAYNTIIKSNLRFVVSIAKTYINRGLDLEDLISEGNMGLLKAYKIFDPSRNYKFITYAVWWIRQSILFALQEYGTTIRIPANRVSGVNKASKLKSILEQKLGITIPLCDIYKYTDEPNLISSVALNIDVVNLDAPINDDSDLSLISAIPSDEIIDGEKLNEAFLEELTLLISDFPKREKEILYYYYGVGEKRSFTLTEIGEKIGLTRERIRQIKIEVLKKIKTHNNSKYLRGFID